MANSKITNLTSGSPAQSGDEIPVNRGGADRKITVGDIATSGLMRELLTADRTYYVRSDGSDSNNGLADTSAGAFLTIQKAFDVIAGLDFNIYNVTLNIGAGTFAAAQIQGPIPGSGTLTIHGNGVGSTFINPDITSYFNSLKFAGIVAGTGNFAYTKITGGFTLNGSGGQGCTLINVQELGRVQITAALSFPGDQTDILFEAEYFAHLMVYGAVTIGASGCGQICEVFDHSEFIFQPSAITFTSTPNIDGFAIGSLEVDTQSIIVTYFPSVTGTATGIRFTVNHGSLIESVNKSATAMPGDTAGFCDNSSLFYDPTSPGHYKLVGATVTASTPLLDHSQTWNSSGVTFAGWKLNVTNTASAAASALMDLQIGGSSIFKARKDGTLINTTDTYFRRNAAANWAFGDSDAASPVAQSLSVQNVVAGTSNTAGVDFTISGSQGTGTGAGGKLVVNLAPAGSTGTSQNSLVRALDLDNSTSAQPLLHVYKSYTDASNYARLTAGYISTNGSYGLKVESAGTGAITTLTLQSAAFNQNIIFYGGSTQFGQFGNGAFTVNKASSSSGYFTVDGDVFLNRRGAANWNLGQADAAAPVAQTLSVQSVVAGTSNTAGVDFTLSMSQGTGTGAGGSFILKVAPAGSTGTSQNALAQVYKIDSTKSLTGGVNVVEYDIGSAIYGDSVTPTPSNGPMQKYTNSGDHMLTPGTNYGYYLVTITNDQYAGTIDTSGWTKVSGDSFDTTDTHKWRCAASITSAASLLVVTALQ